MNDSKPSDLPEGAAEYLKVDHPWLRELERRYRSFDPAVTTPSLWNDSHVAAGDLVHFRGDNGWLWQLRGDYAGAAAYALTYDYLQARDRLGLFDKLREDTKFGNCVFSFADRLISRDLLDSIGEIHFLDRHFGLASRAGLRVLDIGAGYGRLAHRMAGALEGLQSYYCSDAVAVSTFVCDYYLRFRGVKRAIVVPLDEIEVTLDEDSVDFAVNVHSFSECRLQAIEWWARLLRRLRVPRLMVVPNRNSSGGERLLTNEGDDFLPVLEQHGYRTILKEPQYADPKVQAHGLYPTWYHVLELQG